MQTRKTASPAPFSLPGEDENVTSHLHVRLVSPDRLDVCVAAYLDDCRMANLRPRTIEGYANVLRRFHWWCLHANRSLEIQDHDRELVRAFMLYVQSDGTRWGRDDHIPSRKTTKPITHLHYFVTLRTFYRWAVREEYIAASPMEGMRSPKKPKDQPDPFSDTELKRLVDALQAAGDGYLPERNRAIVAVLLDVGIRASELVGIDVADISPNTGDLIVRVAKGGGSRRVILGGRARKATRRFWMRYRSSLGLDGRFFLSIRQEPLTVNGLEQMTRDLGNAARVEPCNPHRFRHTAAISALRAGMNPFEVQAMLGHTDLTMTKRYVKLSEVDMIEAARSHSALDHLKLKL